MPFPQQTPQPFSREGIGRMPGNETGCYGILNAAGVIIYVGKGNLKDRLAAHLGGDNPCITLNRPVFWVGAITPNTDALERQLILELNPVCNRRVG